MQVFRAFLSEAEVAQQSLNSGLSAEAAGACSAHVMRGVQLAWCTPKPPFRPQGLGCSCRFRLATQTKPHVHLRV